MKRVANKNSLDVDGYIAAAADDARAKLRALRKLVKASAPRVEERISYHMPYYKLDGAPLAAFAAFKKHIGLYAVPVKEFEDELAGYVVGRGSVQLPLGKRLPAALVKKLLAARVRAIRARKQK